MSAGPFRSSLAAADEAPLPKLGGYTFLAGIPKERFVTKTLKIGFAQSYPREHNPFLEKPLRSQPMKIFF